MDGMHMDRKVGLEDGKWLMDGQLFNSCVFRKMFYLDKDKTTKSVGFQQSLICPVIGPTSFALRFVIRPSAHYFLQINYQ